MYKLIVWDTDEPDIYISLTADQIVDELTQLDQTLLVQVYRTDVDNKSKYGAIPASEMLTKLPHRLLQLAVAQSTDWSRTRHYGSPIKMTLTFRDGPTLIKHDVRIPALLDWKPEIRDILADVVVDINNQIKGQFDTVQLESVSIYESTDDSSLLGTIWNSPVGMALAPFLRQELNQMYDIRSALVKIGV